jgi:hypothetical protein
VTSTGASRASTTSTSTSTGGRTPPPSSAYAVFGALTGLATLGVLLQGLWAGLFLRYDGHRDDAKNWINVHSLGANIALGLAVLAAVWAIWKLRSRRDLVAGSVVLAVLLGLEGWLGGLIVDSGKDALTAVHVPLAMAIMAVAVWLPLRARSGRA